MLSLIQNQLMSLLAVLDRDVFCCRAAEKVDRTTQCVTLLKEQQQAFTLVL